MDPLHPIVPVPPNIPPVTPAPMTGRIDRDTPRERLDERRRRRRRAESGHPQDAAVDPDQGPHDGGDDSGLHINVMA